MAVNIGKCLPVPKHKVESEQGSGYTRCPGTGGCIVIGIRKLMVKEVIGLSQRHSATYGAEPGESNFELLSVPQVGGTTERIG